jgi:hypothetical protein
VKLCRRYTFPISVRPTHRRCLPLLLLVLLPTKYCLSQSTSAPHQKSSSSSKTFPSKPLSFFVGSWVQSIGDQRDNFLVGPFVQSKSVRMVVANAEKNGDLSVSGSCHTFERRDKMGNQYGNPHIITESSNFNGTITKMGSEYKYNMDTENCNASFVNVHNATGEYLDTQDNVACHSGWTPWSCPSPKTYTLKIASEDEIVLVYKPTGEEVGRFKRE